MDKPETCFECNKGPIEEVQEDYHTLGSEGREITIIGVKMIRCTQCGNKFIPASECKRIDKYRAVFG